MVRISLLESLSACIGQEAKTTQLNCKSLITCTKKMREIIRKSLHSDEGWRGAHHRWEI